MFPPLSLASILSRYDLDRKEDEREFRNAMVLDPDSATAQQWFGEHLENIGRFKEGVIESKRALEVEPFSPIIDLLQGQPFVCACRFDEAIER